MKPEEMRDLLSMEYSKGRYDTITKAIEWLEEMLEKLKEEGLLE